MRGAVTNSFAAYWRLIRPFTLLPPMLGMVAGAGAAAGSLGVHLELALVLRIALGALMAATLNAASNTLNQVFDIEADRINKPHRPLPSGAIGRNAALIFATVLYGAANVMAWFVDSGHGRECFAIVAFTTFLTYAYSGPPLRWRRFGWRANLTVALPRGMLLKVAGWSAVAGVFHDVEPWFLGGIFFLFLLGATTTKDFADVAGDASDGIRTLPVRLGATRAVKAVVPFFVLPWLLFAAAPWLPGRPLRADPTGLVVLGLMTAVYGAWIAALLVKDATSLSAGENHPAWRHMYRLMMVAQIGSALVYWI